MPVHRGDLRVVAIPRSHYRSQDVGLPLGLIPDAIRVANPSSACAAIQADPFGTSHLRRLGDDIRAVSRRRLRSVRRCYAVYKAA